MYDFATGWRELQRNSKIKCPKVFFNLSSSEGGLQLLVTDLIGVWECTLTRIEIIAGAKSQHTSIDPSESTSQLRVLLQKLEQSVGSDQNALYRGGLDDSEILFLRTRCDLPRPLTPLVWNFQLLPQGTHEVSEQLLRPCLFEASVSQQKIKSLEQIIKEKDHVISRLLEKLENSNTDLSLIFPGVKSRRGRVTTAEAEKHVPGMAAFEEAAWLSHFDMDNPYACYDSRGINNLVSGCQKCPNHTPREHQDWIRHLPDSTSVDIDNREQPKHLAHDVSEPTPIHNENLSGSEDEFERQETPPHLKKNQANSATSKEEDGGKSPSSQSTSSPDRSLPQRHKTVSPKHTNHNNPSRPSMSKQNKIGSEPAATLDTDSETASEDDDLDAPSHNLRHQNPKLSSSEVEEKSAIAKTTSKLGRLTEKGKHEGKISSTAGAATAPSVRRLGGLKKSAQQPRHSSEDDDTTERSLRESTPPPARKLGRLGKKPDQKGALEHASGSDSPADARSGRVKHGSEKDADSDATASATPSRSPSPTLPTSRSGQQSEAHPHVKPEPESTREAEPEVELTAEAKADQRREELKRKVDGGAGTRKKRKF